MRNVVLFLGILLAFSCALILNPWIWPNNGAIVDDPHVTSAAPPPGQELPSAPPSSVGPASTKVAAVARPVREVPPHLREVAPALARRRRWRSRFPILTAPLDHRVVID